MNKDEELDRRLDDDDEIEDGDQNADRDDDQNADQDDDQNADQDDDQNADRDDDRNADQDDDQNADQDDDQEHEDPLLKELPEKTRQKIQKRFDRMTAQRERLAREKDAQIEEQKKRADQAEERLKNASYSDPETGLPFPSSFVDETEVRVLKEAQELKEWKRFLRPKRHEGYTDSAGKEITPAQVEARLDEIDDRLERIQGRAATIQERAERQFAEVVAAGREALRKKAEQGRAGRTEPGGRADRRDRKPLDALDRVIRRKPAAPGRARAGGGGSASRGQGARFDADAVRRGDKTYEEMIREHE